MSASSDYYKDKKVLVTGGLGFLGSSIAVALKDLGAKVTIVDGFLETHGANIFNLTPYQKKIDIHSVDLRDKHALNFLVKGQDIIIHIAAHSSNWESIQNPSYTIDLNCHGTLILLEAIRENNPEVKFIFAASRAQYGIVKKLPADERTPMNPLSFYGLSKVVTEHYIRLYKSVANLNYIILRFTNTFGSRHQMKNKYYSVYNYLLRQVIDDEVIEIYGRGNQKRDLMYIDDTVNVCLLAGSKDEAIGKIYNISYGSGIRLVDFVKLAIKCAGTGSLKHIPYPKDWKGFETGDYYGSYKLINKELGWEPKVSHEEGIKKTIEFYRKYKKHYW